MAIDYKAFLKPSDPVVLPYFGGTRVDTAERRLRVEVGSEGAVLEPGWWRFRIDGRRAVPLEPATPGDLAALPAVRGHFVAGWIVVDGRTLYRIALPPEDEPAPLARVVGRRWYSGELLFDTTEFEDDAEVSARRALEERGSLAAIKGVMPSLRAAFGYAIGLEVAAELGVTLSPRELIASVVSIADSGREAVVQAFHELLERRMRQAEEAQRRAAEALEAQRLATATRGARVVRRASDPRQRADEALDKAGARMLSARLIAGGDQLDVTYMVDDERILSLVDAVTLQVLDPGVCLSGEHRVLTLDAMPSVIREAIEDHALNITRH